MEGEPERFLPRELRHLHEEIPINRKMSGRARNRGNNRGAGHAGGMGEDVWNGIKHLIEAFVKKFNLENTHLAELITMDKKAGAVDPNEISNQMMKEMETMTRKGVKLTEENLVLLNNLIEQLQVLRAVVQAQQIENPGASKRGTAREKESSSASVWEFEAAGEASIPSPIATSSSKKGERPTRGTSREDSIPPKADSVEPQGPGSIANALNKSKVLFSRGDTVAFKPKAISGDQSTDWILGEVAQVTGEGKSRRYKVLDIEPDDQSKQKEYRSSASSMIPITPESQAATLKGWEAGKVVLALYPNTTTFYKAEVYSMGEDGKVDLKFEGENDSTTLQQVERRFVIEYRA